MQYHLQAKLTTLSTFSCRSRDDYTENKLQPKFTVTSGKASRYGHRRLATAHATTAHRLELRNAQSHNP